MMVCSSGVSFQVPRARGFSPPEIPLMPFAQNVLKSVATGCNPYENSLPHYVSPADRLRSATAMSPKIAESDLTSSKDFLVVLLEIIAMSELIPGQRSSESFGVVGPPMDTSPALFASLSSPPSDVMR